MKLIGIIALLFILMFCAMIGVVYGVMESKSSVMTSEDWARYITGSPLHHAQRPTLTSFTCLEISEDDSGVITESWEALFDYPDATAMWITTIKYKNTGDRDNLRRDEIVYTVSRGIYARPKTV